MKPEGIFDTTVTLLERALDVRSRKHDAIVSNLSNIDTPNYKAFDVMVEEEMQRLNSGPGPDVAVNKTQPGHLGGSAETMVHLQEKHPANTSLPRGDGNTVELDREMADMAENSLLYSVSVQLLTKKLHALRTVIQGGKS